MCIRRCREKREGKGVAPIEGRRVVVMVEGANASSSKHAFASVFPQVNIIFKVMMVILLTLNTLTSLKLLLLLSLKS